MSSASAIPSSEYAHIKAGIKSAIVLMPLMGVTWVFGLLAVNRDTIVFQYLFAITNSLQGFWIFLSHMVFNNEVRTAFKRHWEKWQLSRESASDYNASYSATNDSQSYESKHKNKNISRSSNSNNNAIARLKARLSMSLMPRTTRVISVQPFSSKSDDSGIHIERKYHNKQASNKLSSPEQEMSSLNSPIIH
ncbi:adhesion G-protein coupled receptor D1-like [Actinia tenebrosa]|uniref:Adhesion G-protein coupled receptor D1-like n=1 Tax=Actinia tenebrosa TaxID=6105 RepID=A0A6P8IEE0_ACTTE|nr:adhesion G-protein coupled receptor D1-like [Actinia tenebrosa]